MKKDNKFFYLFPFKKIIKYTVLYINNLLNKIFPKMQYFY